MDSFYREIAWETGENRQSLSSAYPVVVTHAHGVSSLSLSIIRTDTVHPFGNLRNR